ncbi:hypothetical protein CWO91_18155 [Bradyrhizobium genosp. SA-3]|uniref:hypothetical protein n=1 Tax=Bradyrhizobium genosp. SA-3 TaxID=508868 RepID=UPI0010289E08|nr:hypothetical protein [Bradyrhizobium genosp. SA-3]RZN09304.1 hypothetical protein CWO91_18155 [Bradyrhizobium genosp. SA-3]
MSLPTVFLTVQTVGLIWLGGSFGPFIDPDAAYYFAAINLDAGISIRFLFHPGVSLIVFGGAVIGGASKLLYSGSFGANSLLHFDSLMLIARFSVALFTSSCSLIAGIMVARASSSVPLGLILQAGLFSSAHAVTFGARLMPEPFLVGIASLLVAVTFCAALKSFASMRLSIVAGVLATVGLATKILFLPFILLYPVAAGFRARPQVTYLAAMTMSLILALLPAWKELQIFTGYIDSIAHAKGAYGSGERGFIDYGAAFLALSRIGRDYWIDLLATAISLLILRRQVGSVEGSLIGRTVFAMALVIFASIAIVSKQYYAYYLVPAISIAPFMLGVALTYSRIAREMCSYVRFSSICIGVVIVQLVAGRVWTTYQFYSDANAQKGAEVIVEKPLMALRSTCYVLPSYSVGLFEYPIIFGFLYANRNDDQVVFYNDAIRLSFDRVLLNYDYFNKAVFIPGDMRDVNSVIPVDACVAVVSSYPLFADQLPFKRPVDDICRVGDIRVALINHSCIDLNLPRQAD